MQFELRWYADGAFNLLIEVWDSSASGFNMFKCIQYCSLIFNIYIFTHLVKLYYFKST